MNDTLVRNWNARVKETDIVIFLGDFAFKGAQDVKKWMSLLHGNITFLKGNHDSNSLNTPILSLVIELGGKTMFCTHNPVDFCNSYPINLVGHVHEKWKIKKVASSYLINVGVDVWNFSPVDINEILKELGKFKKGCSTK